VVQEYVEDISTGEPLGRVTMESGDYVWVRTVGESGHFVNRDSVRTCDPLLGMCNAALKWIAKNMGEVKA
jgi:hypothetical protein